MRKLLLVLIGLALALLAVEVCLQIVAYVVWSRRDMPAADAASGGILCIGDSFTYGLGARDRDNAYPNALGRQLAANGHADVPVVNAGWPGNSSSDVLARLPQQLASYRPRLVYLLVGYNDFWSKRPAEQSDGFPFEFRLLRLFGLAREATRGTVEQGSDPDYSMDAQGPQERPPAEADFLGVWHLGSAWFEFRANGSIDSFDGPLPSGWSWFAGTIVLRDLRSGDATQITYRREGESLVLEGGPFTVATPLSPGMPTHDALDRARVALRDGKPDAAETLLREALDTPRGDEARRDLIRFLFARDRGDEALVELGPLRIAWQSNQSVAHAHDFIEACLDAGRTFEAMTTAAEALATLPYDQRIAELLLHHGGKLSNRAPIEHTLEPGLTRTDLSPVELAGLWALYASLDSDDVERRAGALVATLRADLDSSIVRRTLTWQAEKYPREEVVVAVEIQVDDLTERAAILAAFDAMRASADFTRDGLAGNLRAIAALCREAGTQLVLLTYPIARQRVHDTVRDFGSGVGVPVIDISQEFRRRVPTGELDALFVLDGHCNDAGYRLMAEIVAEDALPRIR